MCVGVCGCEAGCGCGCGGGWDGQRVWCVWCVYVGVVGECATVYDIDNPKRTPPPKKKIKTGGATSSSSHIHASASSASVAAAAANTPEMEEILRERGRLEGLLNSVELEIYKVRFVWVVVVFGRGLGLRRSMHCTHRLSAWIQTRSTRLGFSDVSTPTTTTTTTKITPGGGGVLREDAPREHRAGLGRRARQVRACDVYFYTLISRV